MPEQLRAFAPRRCLDHRLLESGTSAHTEHATTVFVDLAGFTTLTARLARLGSRGTEELSALLRHFFGSVTDVVVEHGGDPVAYGGDALIIVFDGPAKRTLSNALLSAEAILELTGRTAGWPTSAGPVTLRCRIGVARGTVTTAVARSARRSLPIHLGRGLDLAADAETAARPGEVVVHPSVRVGDDRHSSTAGGHTDRQLIDSNELARLVHPVVLGRLKAGGGLLESHRTVTVAFVRLPHAEKDAVHLLVRAAGEMLAAVDAGGGEIIQVSGGDKGVVAMIVFGAPVAHEDDASRAVETLLELRGLAPSIAVGVATGPVFTALLGSAQRRFSANSGPAVNLAARLMQAATTAQILVDPATWHDSATHLRPQGVPETMWIKGLEEPVQVRAVAGWRRSRPRTPAAADSLLVGRESELSALERLLEDLNAGQGRLLVVEGDPGVGKTRLVREIAERSKTRGISVVVTDADEHPRGQAAGLWRDLLAGLTGIPARAGRRQWSEMLTALLPDVVGEATPVGRLLGLQRSAAPGAADLPPDVEAEIAQGLFVRVLTTAGLGRRNLLIIENAHHIDEPSRRLLTYLGRSLPSTDLAMLMTRRSHSTTAGSSAQPGRLMRLGELSAPEAALLARDTWGQCGGGTAPEWLDEAVTRRAGGNPLFVRTVTTLLNAHWQPGQPPPRDDFATAPLMGLIAERLDRLPAQPRRLLSLLAVARRPCSPELVARALPEPFDPATMMRIAGQLVRADLLDVEDGGAGERLRLPHEVMQQVLYASMSHAERADLHLRLAKCLGDAGADPVEVAEHVSHLDSPDPDTARRWFPLAAASARASWNVHEAIGWWRRAIPLLAGHERDAAGVELMELLLVGGRPGEVLDLAAGDVSRLDPVMSARWRQAECEAAFVCGDLDRCETAALSVMRLVDAVDEGRHQRASEWLVRVRCERGDTRGAVVTAEEQLVRAKLSGDARALTTARSSLGAALLLAGRPTEAARLYEAARLGATGAGDRVQEVHVLSDLAGCCYESGDHVTCVQLLAQARAVADDIGYRRHLAYNLTNEAQLRSSIGDPGATACARVAVQRSLELGDLATAADALHTWVTAEPGLATAPHYWRRLIVVDSHLGRRGAAAEGWAGLAMAEAQSGHRADARLAADFAADLARELDLPHVRRRAALAHLLADAGTIDAETLDARFASLAMGTDLDHVERAEIAVERWRSTRDLRDRQEAVRLLRAAFSAEPTALVRSWLEETGDPSRRPPSSLPLPVGIGRTRTSRTQLSRALSQLETAAFEERKTPVRSTSALVASF